VEDFGDAKHEEILVSSFAIVDLAHDGAGRHPRAGQPSLGGRAGRWAAFWPAVARPLTFPVLYYARQPKACGVIKLVLTPGEVGDILRGTS
jgi:hypothetical protein